MKISKAHKVFANRLNNQRALDYPEEFLGPNWKDVLNFWLFLDTLSEEQLKILSDRFKELEYKDWNAALAAQDTTWDAADVFMDAADAFMDAGAAAGDAVWDAARVAWAVAMNAARVAAAWATYELIGSHKILSQNKPLTFLPMFLNL